MLTSKNYKRTYKTLYFKIQKTKRKTTPMKTTKLILAFCLLLISLSNFAQRQYSKTALESYSESELNQRFIQSTKLSKAGATCLWSGFLGSGIGAYLAIYGYFEDSKFLTTTGGILFYTGALTTYTGATLWSIGKIRSKRIHRLLEEHSISDFEIKLQPQTNYLLNHTTSTLAFCIRF